MGDVRVSDLRQAKIGPSVAWMSRFLPDAYLLQRWMATGILA